MLLAHEALSRQIALGTSFLTLLISLPLWFLFDNAHSGMQFVEKHQWIDSPAIYYALGIDGISMPLILLTTFLTPLCILVSWTAIQTKQKEFLASLLFMETATIGVFAALDFVVFYVFWETMLIPMYLLIGIWGGPNRVYAAIKFFLYTFAGSMTASDNPPNPASKWRSPKLRAGDDRRRRSDFGYVDIFVVGLGGLSDAVILIVQHSRPMQEKTQL